MQTAKTSSIIGPPGVGLAITHRSDLDYPGRFLNVGFFFCGDYVPNYVGKNSRRKNASVAGPQWLAATDIIFLRLLLKLPAFDIHDVTGRTHLHLDAGQRRY